MTNPDTPPALDLDALVETAAKVLAAAAEHTEGATEDDSRCLKDEAECFRMYPVHFAWYQLGETGVTGETKAIARTVIEAALEPLLSALAAITADLRTARAVALSNKRAHQTAFEECERLASELAAAREQAKQAQAVVTRTLAELTNPMWYGLLDEDVAKMVDEIIALLKGDDTPTGAPEADEPKPRTYRDMPVVRCEMVGRDLSHMAHVYFDDERGEKVACSGLLPHSVPLDAEPVPTGGGECTCDLNLRKVCDTCAAGGEDGSGTAAERRTCGHAYVGNVGEFTCDLYAPHDGKHWNSLAEFGWSDGSGTADGEVAPC